MTTKKTLKDAFDGVVARYWAGSKNEMGAIRNAKCCLEHFGESSCLQSITPQKIEEFVVALRDAGNGNSTINRKLAALSKMLRYAYNMEWTDRIAKIEKTKESKNRIRWLIRPEEAKLKDVLLTMKRPELANLVTFLVDTGARVGEALRLEWRDVADHRATFWDTKNGESRTIPLTKRVMAMLEYLKKENQSGPFTTINQSSFNHAWNNARNVMGLAKDREFVPHALRHTCASRLVQAGIPLTAIKEFLGHKNIQMTLRYAHLSPAQLQEATNALEEV
jgi:integrase